MKKENLFLFQQSGIQALKRNLEEYRQEEKQVQAEKNSLYERYALTKLPVSEYQKKAAELTDRSSSLSVMEKQAKEKPAVLEDEYRKSEEDMKQIIWHSHIGELTQEVVDTFIKKVYTYKDIRVEIE